MLARVFVRSSREGGGGSSYKSKHHGKTEIQASKTKTDEEIEDEPAFYFLSESEVSDDVVKMQFFSFSNKSS